MLSKRTEFPAINDDLYKVQIVISATGSRAELSIFINMRRSRGALNDGGATGKKRGVGSGNNRGVGGGGSGNNRGEGGKQNLCKTILGF